MKNSIKQYFKISCSLHNLFIIEIQYEQHMEVIDKKDRRILYELDRNARKSISQIGKTIGLSKNTVNYRITRMEKLGIIKNYYAVINSYKIGYNMFRFYIVYRHITPDIRKEIIDYFVENKFTWWVASFEGSYDLCIVFWIKEINDFHASWDEALKKYRKYFREIMFFDYVQLKHFHHSFILEDEKEKNRTKMIETGGGKREEIDELDCKIMRYLSKNSRIQTIDIAKKLKVSSNTILNRMKRLEQLDILQAYRANIDFSKLGYHLYKLNIDLIDYNQRGIIINYIKQNPHLIMIDKAIGYYDLELDFYLKDLDHLHDIMDDLTTKFPNDIRNYSYVHDPILHKLLYIPES